MLTQEQYNALCALVAENGNLNLAKEAVADLLESFELLHVELMKLCDRGHACVGVSAFEALFDDRGEQRVELVCHGRARL